MMTDDRVAWGLAGLFSTDGGYLERSLDGFGLVVPPGLRLDGDSLRWQWRDREGEWLDPERFTMPGVGVLEQFVDLADGSADDVLAYASKWGTLLLCPCTRYYSHRPVYDPVPGGLPACSGPPPGDLYDVLVSEPLEAWFRYARRARALLRLAANVFRDERDPSPRPELLTSADGDNSLELWRHYEADHVDRCNPSAEDHQRRNVCGSPSHLRCVCGSPKCYRLTVGTYEIGHVIDGWLDDTGVRLRFLWLASDRPELFVGRYDGLLGEIVLQLALASARADAIAFCSSCSRPYAPRRKPAANRNNYCPTCRDTGRWRDAQRRRRAVKASS